MFPEKYPPLRCFELWLPRSFNSPSSCIGKNMNNLLRPAFLCHLWFNRSLLTALSPSASFFKKHLLTFKELPSWHWVQLYTIWLLLQGSGCIIVATAPATFWWWHFERGPTCYLVKSGDAFLLVGPCTSCCMEGHWLPETVTLAARSDMTVTLPGGSPRLALLPRALPSQHLWSPAAPWLGSEWYRK